jgi:TorA maturation chaperone TorD
VREEQNQLYFITEVRASVYCALAVGFSAPSKRNLQKLSSQLLEVMQQRRSLNVWPSLDGRIKALQASINGFERLSLRAEYHRLFVGPYKLPAPPYASVYLESEPTVMGPSTLKVLRMYEEAGFLLSPSFKDLPDHIAAELEFMALLCEEEGAAWQGDDLCEAASLLSREDAFLAQHLVRWIPDFASKIISTTESPFYRGLASLLQDYVLFDLDCVRALRRLLEARETTPLMKEGAMDGA